MRWLEGQHVLERTRSIEADIGTNEMREVLTQLKSQECDGDNARKRFRVMPG